MKATYRNKIRSRELIKEAVILLLEKKGNVSNITVSDVVKVANINRGTFYNNYNNILEVLNEYKTEMINAFITQIAKVSSFKDFEMLFDALVKHFKENEERYRKIVNGVSTSLIDDLKSEFIKKVLQTCPKIDSFELNFTVNALVGMYVDYLKNISDFSIDEIGQKSIIIINKIFAKQS